MLRGKDGKPKINRFSQHNETASRQLTKLATISIASIEFYLMLKCSPITSLDLTIYCFASTIRCLSLWPLFFLHLNIQSFVLWPFKLSQNSTVSTGYFRVQNSISVVRFLLEFFFLEQFFSCVGCNSRQTEQCARKATKSTQTEVKQRTKYT